MQFISGMPRSTGIFVRGPRPDCQKTALITFFVVVFLVLNLFYSFTEGFQWLFQRKLLFQGLRGVQHFPGAVQLFQGGGGGFLMLISIETQITCDCAAAQTVFIEELAHLIYKVQ